MNNIILHACNPDGDMFISIGLKQSFGSKRKSITTMVCVLLVPLMLTACAPKVIEQAEQLADELLAAGALHSKQIFGNDYSLHYVYRGGIQAPAFFLSTARRAIGEYSSGNWKIRR